MLHTLHPWADTSSIANGASRLTDKPCSTRSERGLSFVYDSCSTARGWGGRSLETERARRLAQSAGWLRAEAALHHMAADYDKAISCLLRDSR